MQPTVVLGDYGGPENLSRVRPFLYRIFSDRRIISLPSLVRLPLAFLISTLRNRKSCEIYSRIGGSPVNRTVSEMCRILNEKQSVLHFEPGFRYMAPFFREVVKEASREGPVLVLPTFPHYSFSSYGSMEDAATDLEGVRLVDPYYNNDTFAQLLYSRIRGVLEDLGPEPAAILLTAHSIPESTVRKGDPYITQVQEQAEGIRAQFPDLPVKLAFQSPLGPVKWVGPFLEESVQALARDGIRRLVVAPLSFTVDNSETLYELDMYLREFAGKMGMEQLDRVPCFNTDGGFLDFLLDYAGSQLKAMEPAENPV
ncbi:MAG: ferrochelatase [Holophagae bacterium]|nr:ferrochelatase [Holophagae bacterium]